MMMMMVPLGSLPAGKQGSVDNPLEQLGGALRNNYYRLSFSAGMFKDFRETSAASARFDLQFLRCELRFDHPASNVVLLHFLQCGLLAAACGPPWACVNGLPSRTHTCAQGTDSRIGVAPCSNSSMAGAGSFGAFPMALHLVGVDHWPTKGRFLLAVTGNKVFHKRRGVEYDRKLVCVKGNDEVFTSIMHQCPAMPFNVEPSSHRLLLPTYIARAAEFAYLVVRGPNNRRTYPCSISEVSALR